MPQVLGAIAALAATDGTARAIPMPTAPGRGYFELETTSGPQTRDDPKVTGLGGEVPSSVTLPVAETARGYDFGNATYPGAPAWTGDVLPDTTHMPINPVKIPLPGADRETTSTKPTDAPSPLVPLGIPFSLPYLVNTTRESDPVETDKPGKNPFIHEHGLPQFPEHEDVDHIESVLNVIPTLEARQLVDDLIFSGGEGPVGSEIVPTPTGDIASRDTDGPFPGPDGRIAPQIVPIPENANVAQGTDGPFPLPDGRVGPQIVPTLVNNGHAAQGTDGPFPGPDGRVGPQIVPGKEDSMDRS